MVMKSSTLKGFAWFYVIVGIITSAIIGGVFQTFDISGFITSLLAGKIYKTYDNEYNVFLCVIF